MCEMGKGGNNNVCIHGNIWESLAFFPFGVTGDLILRGGGGGHTNHGKFIGGEANFVYLVFSLQTANVKAYLLSLLSQTKSTF